MTPGQKRQILYADSVRPPGYNGIFALIAFIAISFFNVEIMAGDLGMEEKFNSLKQLEWKNVFKDKGDKDWQAKWFLDGERAQIKNTPKGMVFSAGPIVGDNASHAVLWTKDSFSGDVKIQFDFTRLDTINRYVNILYIQATGIEEEPYSKDIAEWSELRQVPYMKSYFDTMNLLHISYAAFNNDDDKPDDYVRARRYPTRPGKPFDQIDIKPDNFNTGLFIPGETYHFTCIKSSTDLFLEVKNDKIRKLFHWSLKGIEPVDEGRIGIRHMFTRCSRYANMEVSTLN